jgi:hypothetical protein
MENPAHSLTFKRRHPEAPRFLQRGEGSRAYLPNRLNAFPPCRFCSIFSAFSAISAVKCF